MSAAKVMRWSSEAGLMPYQEQAPGIDGAVGSWEALQAFAALAFAAGAEAMREAAAQSAEASWPEMHKYWGDGQARAACMDCAVIIRALPLPTGVELQYAQVGGPPAHNSAGPDSRRLYFYCA